MPADVTIARERWEQIRQLLASAEDLARAAAPFRKYMQARLDYFGDSRLAYHEMFIDTGKPDTSASIMRVDWDELRNALEKYRKLAQ
jgi:hypothetical protein